MKAIKRSWLICAVVILCTFFRSQAAERNETMEYIRSIVDKYEEDSLQRTAYYNYLNYCCFQFESLLDSMECDNRGLYSLPSFISVGAELFSDDFIGNSPKTYPESYLYDYRLNYLFLCDDESALRTLGDLFLKEYNPDGLMGLWGKFDISELPHYGDFLYKAIISNNVYDLCALIVFAKNSGNEALQSYLEEALRLMIKTDSNAERIINEVNAYDKVTYEDFAVDITNLIADVVN